MDMVTDRRAHWDGIYASGTENDVSWFECRPEMSVSAILGATSSRGAVIDIGGGASRLPDALLDAGFADIAGLDLSAAALSISRRRLGVLGRHVRWIVADVTRWSPDRCYDVWHDRAALHFLTDPADQGRYASVVERAVAPGGVVVIGTFAPDGPERCSGLPVVRHDSLSLQSMLGSGFALIGQQRHAHHAPGGAVQSFQFSSFRRV